MTQLLSDHRGITPDLRPSSPPRLGRYVALSAVIALILGAVGGFLAGRTTASEKTVTKTVTVATSAYATSSTIAATVVFDGAMAAYSGPAEMKAGTVATFTFTSKDAVLIVGRINDAVTWESANAYTSTTQPTWMHNDYTASNPGNDSITVTMTEGLWAVTALTPTESTNRSYVATLIRVTK